MASVHESGPSSQSRSQATKDSDEDIPAAPAEPSKRSKRKKKKAAQPAPPPPPPPKKLTKKERLAEQRRKEKEMADIARDLEIKRQADAEKERIRLEKEKAKEEERKKEEEQRRLEMIEQEKSKLAHQKKTATLPEQMQSKSKKQRRRENKLNRKKEQEKSSCNNMASSLQDMVKLNVKSGEDDWDESNDAFSNTSQQQQYSGFNQNGTSGFGNSGSGNSGFTKNGFGDSGFNKNGFGNNGFNKNGFGDSGFGKNGFGNDGFGSGARSKHSADGFGARQRAATVPGNQHSASHGHGQSAWGQPNKPQVKPEPWANRRVNASAAPPPSVNVWQKRTEIQSAFPTNQSEEEEMIQAALEMSRLEAEKEQIRNKMEEEIFGSYGVKSPAPASPITVNTNVSQWGQHHLSPTITSWDGSGDSIAKDERASMSGPRARDSQERYLKGLPKVITDEAKESAPQSGGEPLPSQPWGKPASQNLSEGFSNLSMQDTAPVQPLPQPTKSVWSSPTSLPPPAHTLPKPDMLSKPAQAAGNGGWEGSLRARKRRGHEPLLGGFENDVLPPVHDDSPVEELGLSGLLPGSSQPREEEASLGLHVLAAKPAPLSDMDRVDMPADTESNDSWSDCDIDREDAERAEDPVPPKTVPEVAKIPEPVAASQPVQEAAWTPAASSGPPAPAPVLNNFNEPQAEPVPSSLPSGPVPAIPQAQTMISAPPSQPPVPSAHQAASDPRGQRPRVVAGRGRGRFNKPAPEVGASRDEEVTITTTGRAPFTPGVAASAPVAMAGVLEGNMPIAGGRGRGRRSHRTSESDKKPAPQVQEVSPTVHPTGQSSSDPLKDASNPSSDLASVSPPPASTSPTMPGWPCFPYPGMMPVMPMMPGMMPVMMPGAPNMQMMAMMAQFMPPMSAAQATKPSSTAPPKSPSPPLPPGIASSRSSQAPPVPALPQNQEELMAMMARMGGTTPATMPPSSR